MSRSLGSVLLEAGLEAARQFVNLGDCPFCRGETAVDHDAACPFAGLSFAEMKKAVEVMDAFNPAETCVGCHHSMNDHFEGACQVAGCACFIRKGAAPCPTV